MKHAD